MGKDVVKRGPWYVYHQCDSDTPDIPFYIGKGKGNRLNDHERDAKRGVQSAVCIRIREILARGGHIVKRKVFETWNERLAWIYEAQQIRYWRDKTELTNRVSPSIIMRLTNAEIRQTARRLARAAREE